MALINGKNLFYCFVLSNGPRLRKWHIDSRPACLLMFKIKASIRTFLDVKDNKNSVCALAWDCLTRCRHRSVRDRNGGLEAESEELGTPTGRSDPSRNSITWARTPESLLASGTNTDSKSGSGERKAEISSVRLGWILLRGEAEMGTSRPT